MKIRPRVFKYQQGRKFLKDLIDFDPKNYTSEYDNVLVDADFTDNSWNPWESKLQGTAPRRYVPTPHGTFGENKDHYTYTKGVEQTPYYLLFTRDLLDENGKFTPVGEQWARAVDALIPNGEATFYDPNTGQLRTQWNVTTKDSHGRKPVNFTKLSDYVNAIRNDLILGARHNVFRKRGKRYFYIDKDGTKHWVNPNDIEGFTVSENPVESGYSDDKTTWWDDYQLTEPGENSENPLNPENPYGITGQHNDKYGFDWDKAKQYVNKYLPDLISAGRLLGNINNNNRVFREMEAGIRPNLMQPYLTHRQVVGDEGTKLAYYRRGVLGLTKAGRAVTSNMDLQIAYLMEAKRAADELRALGDLADNQEIRRTSDESNQHQWANAQRRAEVANNNVVAINKANYDWHQLEAGRKSANWTSFDNWLLGKETKLEKEKLRKQAILDLIWTLDEQNKMQNDELLLDAYNNLSTIYDLVAEEYKKENKTTSPANDPRVKEAKRAYDLRKYLLQKQLYYDMLNRPLSAKSGMKFTFKSKDDLLYKTARDAAYHFKDMVNLTIKDKKKTPKAPKLVPHPKGNAKKYLQGGTAPFTIYRPATVGGEQSIQSSSDDSINGRSSKSSKQSKDETLDVIKDLFKNLEGLPSDVNGVYQSMSEFLAKSKLFGNELSTEDIASMYLQQMQLINNIKFSKAAYDKAKEEATKNEALNEFAVDGSGRVAVQNRDTGKIDFKSWSDVKENLDTFNPLTNNDLLNLRAYTKDLQFLDLLFNIVNNGIGVTKIADFIKNHLPSLGNSEQTIEGYTKKQSNQIRQGFELLLQDAPDGDYHYSRKTQDLKELIKMALGYIKTILPRNMKAVLNIHADMQGVSPDDMLKVLLGSESTTINDLKLTAITGKGAKDSDGKSKSDDDSLTLDAATAFITGKGYQSTIDLNTGSSYAVQVNARYSEFQKHSGENMGAGITMQEATTSTLKGVLDWNKATLGGSTINPTAYNQVILNNGEVAGVDLPVKSDNKNVPDFEMLKKLETLDKQLLVKGIQDTPENWQQVNAVCSELGIPAKYDNQGNLNKHNWNRFAAFLVVTTDKALNDKNVILDMLGTADENTREFYENIMKKKSDNKDYSLDDGFLFWGGEELYQGTVFVPIKNSIVAAAISGGRQSSATAVSMNEATNLELKEKGYDPSKVATYQKPTFTL